MTYLSPALRAEVEPHRKSRGMVVKEINGQQVKPVADSQIMVIGDSFTNFGLPSGANFVACLSRFVNQPVSLLNVDGNTDHAFKEMARNPEILEPVKAVVWIANQSSFTTPYISGWPKEWTIPPGIKRKR